MDAPSQTSWKSILVFSRKDDLGGLRLVSSNTMPKWLLANIPPSLLHPLSAILKLFCNDCHRKPSRQYYICPSDSNRRNKNLSGACIISFHSMEPIQFGELHVPSKYNQFFLNCEVPLDELCNVHEVVNFIFPWSCNTIFCVSIFENLLKSASLWSHLDFGNLDETQNASSSGFFFKILHFVFESINMGLDNKLFLQLFVIGFCLFCSRIGKR